jgi:hypothetical protein
MHIGFSASLRLGSFGWITCITIVGLLPPWFFEKTISYVSTKERLKIKIYCKQGYTLGINLIK